MEKHGHKCVGWCEKDKFAQKSYRAIHDTEGEWFADDITTVQPRELPEADVYCGGFPCQSFSIAGERGGFDDTRGTLFFEIMRLAKERQPKYLFLENVRGLLSHDGGKTFATILNSLHDVGYEYVEWQMLNSKDFGVPQNRERVFIIGHLRGASTRKVFPIRRKNTGTLKEHTSGMSQGYRVYDTKGIACTQAAEGGGLGAKTGLYLQKGLNTTKGSLRCGGDIQCIGNIYPSGGQNGNVYNPEGVSPSLQSGQGVNGSGIGSNNAPKVIQKGLNTTEEGDSYCIDSNYHKGISPNSYGVKIEPLRWVRTEKAKEIRRKNRKEKGIDYSPFSEQKLDTKEENVVGTLTSVQKDNLLKHNARIRKLTPKECWRLQGFPDWAFEKAAEVNSDTQLYKQAGNSVTVNVIEEIAKRLN